ncbi:hypothetical protein E3N88_15621 [Mikania micrantha]|uniref:Uncharacterized protein n=1 Tax=Mikania micrantha TaxID=192012 RepID=A0A5N6NXR2_9ASTR|nr:hypothetical protein E3N88_15621 [Mikania micrantha]
MCIVNNLIITIIILDIAPREPFARRGSRSNPPARGNKHVYLVLKYKETSSWLGENGHGIKEGQKLNSGFPRATRQQFETLSRYARGGKDQNTL